MKNQSIQTPIGNFSKKPVDLIFKNKGVPKSFEDALNFFDGYTEKQMFNYLDNFFEDGHSQEFISGKGKWLKSEILRDCKYSKNGKVLVTISELNYEGDTEEKERLSINGYFLKPSGYENFEKIFRTRVSDDGKIVIALVGYEDGSLGFIKNEMADKMRYLSVRTQDLNGIGGSHYIANLGYVDNYNERGDAEILFGENSLGLLSDFFNEIFVKDEEIETHIWLQLGEKGNPIMNLRIEGIKHWSFEFNQNLTKCIAIEHFDSEEEAAIFGKDAHLKCKFLQKSNNGNPMSGPTGSFDPTNSSIIIDAKVYDKNLLLKI